jgi:hypothetical protein
MQCNSMGIVLMCSNRNHKKHLGYITEGFLTVMSYEPMKLTMMYTKIC